MLKRSAPNTRGLMKIRKLYAEGNGAAAISHHARVEQKSVEYWIDHYIKIGKLEPHDDYVAPETAEEESDDNEPESDDPNNWDTD